MGLLPGRPLCRQCLPGAEITDDKGDGVYAGKLGVKLGPLPPPSEGRTVTPDEANRTASIKGKGVDRRGGSRGQVTVDSGWLWRMAGPR